MAGSVSTGSVVHLCDWSKCHTDLVAADVWAAEIHVPAERRPCGADQPGVTAPTHCSPAAAPETCAPVHNGNKLWLTETLSSWWDYCTHRETTAVRCWSARHLIAVSLFFCGCSRNLRSCPQRQQALTDNNNNNNNTTTTVLQPLCSHSALTDTSS